MEKKINHDHFPQLRKKKLNELNKIINKYDLKISLDDFRIKRREFLDLIPS